MCGEFFVVGSFDDAKSSIEVGGMLFPKVSLGISLHVDNAELYIGIWEEALANREKAGEVILDDEKDTAETSLDEATKDGSPVLQVLASKKGLAGENTLLAITAEADDEINTSGTKAVAVTDFDELAIEENSQEIGVHGARISEFEFLGELGRDGVEVVVVDGKTEFVKSGLGRLERARGSEKSGDEVLGLLGKAALIERRKEGGTEGSGTGPCDVNGKRDGAEKDGARVGSVGFVVGTFLEESGALGGAETREHLAQDLAQGEVAKAERYEFVEGAFGIVLW